MCSRCFVLFSVSCWFFTYNRAIGIFFCSSPARLRPTCQTVYYTFIVMISMRKFDDDGANEWEREISLVGTWVEAIFNRKLCTAEQRRISQNDGEINKRFRLIANETVFNFTSIDSWWGFFMGALISDKLDASQAVRIEFTYARLIVTFTSWLPSIPPALPLSE